MLFFSPKFFLFFIIVFVLYWTVKQAGYRKLILLIASYIFYAAWDYKFLGLIVFSTALDYVIGLMLGRAEKESHRKLLVTVSLVGNLGVLFFFKYFDFFTSSFAELLSFFSVEVDPIYLNVILPVGISFYTFQTLSYTIDVYRKKIRPERSALNLAVFVAFFPQLTAGPIVRASSFLPQLHLTQRLQNVPWKGAVALFVLGLFKKLVVADNCALYVDAVYANPTQYDAYSIVVAVLLFGVQIYCDFSGYSDMAIALAKLLGFKFPQNFSWPYFARNTAVFWNRWHMSLSFWFRDYVYRSLVGVKRGRFRLDFCMLLTFILSGLWHGAAWNFVIFGLMQGAAIVLVRYVRLFKKQFQIDINNDSLLLLALSVIITHVWFCLASIFFRAPDLLTAMEMVVTFITFSSEGTETLSGFILFIWLALVGLHWIAWKFDLISIAQNMKPTVYGLVLGGYIAIIIAARPSHEAPFVYFQF